MATKLSGQAVSKAANPISPIFAAIVKNKIPFGNNLLTLSPS
jgi:hypothetical protein